MDREYKIVLSAVEINQVQEDKNEINLTSTEWKASKLPQWLFLHALNTELVDIPAWSTTEYNFSVYNKTVLVNLSRNRSNRSSNPILLSAILFDWFRKNSLKFSRVFDYKHGILYPPLMEITHAMLDFNDWFS